MTVNGKLLDDRTIRKYNLEKKMKLQDILDEIFEETTNEDLRNWFKKKWVNIGKKDKSGKHPPCGTSGKKRDIPMCT